MSLFPWSLDIPCWLLDIQFFSMLGPFSDGGSRFKVQGSRFSSSRRVSIYCNHATNRQTMVSARYILAHLSAILSSTLNSEPLNSEPLAENTFSNSSAPSQLLLRSQRSVHFVGSLALQQSFTAALVEDLTDNRQEPHMRTGAAGRRDHHHENLCRLTVK